MNAPRLSALSRILPRLAALACLLPCPGRAGERTEVDLSGPGWSLWADTKAAWKEDVLFAPPVDLTQVPTNPPTGGWEQLAPGQARAVSVPGTVEQYLVHDPDPTEIQPAKIYAQFQGVSWWFRSVHIPETARGQRLLLHFEAARLRAEVYVNRQLVAYDLVGDTPFEADLTGVVAPGEDCQLAVRITNPGGNISWEDFRQLKWGKYLLPECRAFGGVTGKVTLLAVDPVYIQDVSVQNTPAITKVKVTANVLNTTAGTLRRDVHLRVFAQNDPRTEIVAQDIPGVELGPGNNAVPVEIDAPQAKAWDLDNPNLYTCETSLKNGDCVRTTFGFRWFAPDGLEQNALFRLNGKRIVLRTSISWGYWPRTALTPSPELAERQIRTAKSLGLNMLNFHRHCGQPVVLDAADRLGLLYYEEPGGYVGGGPDPFGQALAREKLLRLVRRDRNHPSTVIYDLINEQWEANGADKNPAVRENFRHDMQAAHALDPSRQIVLASSWARGGEEDMFVKMNMRPFDDAIHLNGWWDFHRAAGPETWKESFYNGPDNHYAFTKNAREIVYWGEEGAIAAPPRLALIKDELAASPGPGWDDPIYLAWYRTFDEFLTRKHLRGAFPDVDALCLAMGNMSLEHQGRKIEDLRICDLNDGYAVNGWEAMPFENHSGIVDEFRHAKGDPAILARYNRPLAVAVKVRRQQVYTPAKANAVVDFYVLNEVDLRGAFTLAISGVDAQGHEFFTKRVPVTLLGGDVYGQFVSANETIPLSPAPGLEHLRARLLDAKGQERAAGADDVLMVDWKPARIAGRGAVLEAGHEVGDFLQDQLHVSVPAYADALGKLDWLVIAQSPDISRRLIADRDFIDADGAPGQLTTTFYHGDDFKEAFTAHRHDGRIYFEVEPGAPPDAGVSATENYGVRWEGELVPPANGKYLLMIDRANPEDGTRLFIDGKEVANDWKIAQEHREVPLELEAGNPVRIKLEYFHGRGAAKIHLSWKVPGPEALDAEAILKRAALDGTTIVLADYADEWMAALQQVSAATSAGRLDIGTSWRGGQYFVKDHPLFRGLPVNVALSWPYQTVVQSGRSRYVLKLDGEELVCGGYEAMGCQLGTAVGIVPCGAGKVLVSTLDICPHLSGPSGAADVARKLFCNYLEFASGQAEGAGAER